MNRMHLASTLVMTAVSLVGCSQAADSVIPAEFGGSADASEATRIWTKLQETIVDAAFKDSTLEEVVESLDTRYELNLLVEWPALEAAAIERDARIDIRLEQVPLAVLVDAVLDQAGAGEVDLGYEVIRGVLTVATGEHLSRYTHLRIYHVGDLLARGYAMHRYGKLPERRYVFDWTPPAFYKADIARFEGPDALLMLIVNTVAPGLWQINGGNVGIIWTYGEVLVVSQTRSVHREIEKLLDLLRAAHDLPRRN